MTWQASKPSSGECGDFPVVVITDEQGWVGEVREDVASLVLAAEAMREALEEARAEIDYWHADILTEAERNHPRGSGWARVADRIDAALSRCRPSVPAEPRGALWAERHQDDKCRCGHEGYLHDDGLDACVECAIEGRHALGTQCMSHEPAAPSHETKEEEA